MKVAVVHYWLVTMRGGEKALPPLIRNRCVYTSPINGLPFARSLYQTYMPLMPGALTTARTWWCSRRLRSRSFWILSGSRRIFTCFLASLRGTSGRISLLRRALRQGEGSWWPAPARNPGTSGGVLDTVREHETSLFFDEQTLASLMAALDTFEAAEKDFARREPFTQITYCRKSAERRWMAV